MDPSFPNFQMISVVPERRVFGWLGGVCWRRDGGRPPRERTCPRGQLPSRPQPPGSTTTPSACSARAAGGPGVAAGGRARVAGGGLAYGIWSVEKILAEVQCIAVFGQHFLKKQKKMQRLGKLAFSWPFSSFFFATIQTNTTWRPAVRRMLTR